MMNNNVHTISQCSGAFTIGWDGGGGGGYKCRPTESEVPMLSPGLRLVVKNKFWRIVNAIFTVLALFWRFVHVIKWITYNILLLLY